MFRIKNIFKRDKNKNSSNKSKEDLEQQQVHREVHNINGQNAKGGVVVTEHFEHKPETPREDNADLDRIKFDVSQIEQQQEMLMMLQDNLPNGNTPGTGTGTGATTAASSIVPSLNSDYLDMDSASGADTDRAGDEEEEEEDLESEEGERELIYESGEESEDEDEREKEHRRLEREAKLFAEEEKRKKREAREKYAQLQNMSKVQQLQFQPRKLFKEQDGLKQHLLLEKIGEGAFSKVYRAVKFDMNLIYTHTGDYSASGDDNNNNTDQFFAVKVISKKMMEGTGGGQGQKSEQKNSTKQQVLKEIMIHKLASQRRVTTSKTGGGPVEETPEIDFDTENGWMHVVEFVDFVETENYYYMIQELLTGGEIFGEIVNYTYFSEDLSRFVIRQLALAIKHLHSLGIVHRDIKPENLLFSRIPFRARDPTDPMEQLVLRKSDDPNNKKDEGVFVPHVGGAGIGVVKLADFGLSKQIINMNNNDTTKTPCGTVGYTAPEVVKDERYSFQVDMWGIGCVLYTVLCGFPPFYDDKIDVLTEKISRGQYTFLRPWWDEISEGAKHCVSRLLEVDPSKRYTIDELLRDPWFMSYDCAPGVDFTKNNNNNYNNNNTKTNTTGRRHIKDKYLKKKHHHLFAAETPSTTSSTNTYTPPSNTTTTNNNTLLYSPAAVAMRDAFDISNAVLRREEESETNDSSFSSLNNTMSKNKKNSRNKRNNEIGGLESLQETEELDTSSSYNTTASAYNTNPVPGTINDSFFQLRLNSSTIVKRRQNNNNKNNKTSPAVSSPLSLSV